MVRLSRRKATILISVAAILPCVQAQSSGDDQHAVIHLLKAMFDTPGNPLQVEPVVVVGDHAIAGWVQGERGGRALLRRGKGEWAIHLCSGDGLKHAAFLEQTGIVAEQAKLMEAELAAAEAGLDPIVLAKFASFEGTMMIGSDGQHAGHGSNIQGQ